MQSTEISVPIRGVDSVCLNGTLVVLPGAVRAWINGDYHVVNCFRYCVLTLHNRTADYTMCELFPVLGPHPA